ncbi:MAG TPA: acetyl-CoA carboxylase biotin carboxylase subunit [Sandaracinaceae bacterium]
MSGKARPVTKVLIANRGEIAVRIIRACRELGIATVAVHSDIDTESLHVRLADQAVCIGPAPSPQSYMNVPAIIAAAEITGADAIHPGYGFLSENADFADTCERCGLTFIGPSPQNMREWGAKVPARELARRLGLPLLPGTGVLTDVDDAVRKADEIGYPVILKASAGGGGRGMKIVRDAATLRRVFPQAQAEAVAGFKNGDLYLERYVEEPRHIEFQVLCDGEGRALVLGERECSIQRRHQKLVEEAPSVAVTQEMRRDMTRTIERAMRESGYRSAGTLEFLLDERGNLYFMEMNTRIQVEHPVTEAVTGVDLIREQLRIVRGEGISVPPDREVVLEGHAIECRINAEDPETFAPWPGLITEYHPPGGAGVRVDAGVYGGWRVPGNYDSLLLKLITYGKSRPEAITRMERALSETLVGGIRTNVPLHMRIVTHPDFRDGRLSTRFLERLRTNG